jgi:hypothetical protein
MRFVEVYQIIGWFRRGDRRRKCSPLYLKNRRPDLWTLELTCDNTNTLIPYLTVVNQVLESHLLADPGGTSPDRNALYRALGEARDSFHQPFLLPLTELRLYLSHFGLTLAALYAALGQPRPAIQRETLRLSEASAC